MSMTCFVTGRRETLPYHLGSTNPSSPLFAPVRLTQEVSAYFILRSTKDEIFQGLEREITALDAQHREMAKSSVPEEPFVYLRSQVALSRISAELSTKLADHLGRAVEILHQMKVDFELTNRLSS